MSITPEKPLLAVTMGDPSGIGPEIIAAAWARPQVHDLCRMVVLGNAEVMRRAIALRQSVAMDQSVADPTRTGSSFSSVDPSPSWP